jgi:hypothetical protein
MGNINSISPPFDDSGILVKSENAHLPLSFHKKYESKDIIISNSIKDYYLRNLDDDLLLNYIIDDDNSGAFLKEFECFKTVSDEERTKLQSDLKNLAHCADASTINVSRFFRSFSQNI